MKRFSSLILGAAFIFFSSTLSFGQAWPSATTGLASGITPTSAGVSGEVNAAGENVMVYFEYWETVGSEILVSATPSTASGVSNTPVTGLLSELNPGTTYSYRVKITWDCGGEGCEEVGSTQEFSTPLFPPAAYTNDANGIGVDSANLNGTVLSNGNLIESVDFEFGTDTMYGTVVNAPYVQTNLPRDVLASTGNVLANNTIYHFRLRITYDSGTFIYGEDKTFFTGSVPGPSATTQTAESVGSGSATLKGLVDPNDLSTQVTFEYGQTVLYGTTVLAVESPVSGDTSVSVSKPLVDLLPSTTYHYRVTATNGAGSYDGLDMTFTTLPMPPSAITGSPDSVTATTATLNGVVNPNGSSTTVTFQYGLTTSYGTTVTADQSPATGTDALSVSKGITGLVDGFVYHFRVVASSAGGTTYGSDISFTAGAVPPIVTTQSAAGVTASAATLNGTGNANGSETTLYFQYGTTTAYNRQIAAVPSNITGSSDNPVTADLTGLVPGTTYHYRLAGQNTGGVSYGNDMTFTTEDPPVAITEHASGISSTDATLNGTVNANGVSTTVTFEYGLDIRYGSTVTATESPVTGSSDTPVSGAISGLSDGVTYHYRVVAQNTNGISYGEDMIFIATAPAAPVATTMDPVYENDKVLLTGLVNPMNAVTTVTFEYGATPAYGTTVSAAQSPLAAGTAEVTVSAEVTGLIPGTMYFYRVVATNASGTTNGAMKFFTYIDSVGAPVAVTLPATSVTATTAVFNGMGDANNNGQAVLYFQYGTTTAFGSTINANPSILDGDALVSVTADITGLLPGTKYYYRFMLSIDGLGTFYGYTYRVDTLLQDPVPSVQTDPASAIGTTDATLNGTINPNNSTAVVTFEYGLNTSYGNTVFAVQSPLTGSTSTAVSFNLDTLAPNTTYHYRVVAENSGNTITGEDVTFTTNQLPPTAETTGATDVTSTTATLNGVVNANNVTTTVTFEYGTTTSYGTTVTADQSDVAGGSNTAVSKGITGLTNGVTYHYRVKAVSAGGTTYGDDVSFTSGTTPPEVTTNPATSITTSGAVLNGTVNANNNSTNVTFEYGLTTAYGSSVPADQTPVTGAVGTDVTATLSGLLFGNTYHYRVVANSATGSVAGLDETFTTVVNPVVSGTITDGVNPIENVQVEFSYNSETHYAYTASDGTYSYEVPFNTTVTITPSHVGYHGWTPPSVTYTDLLVDAPGTDFTGVINTYTISGTVTDGINPLAGVTLTFSHDSGTTFTDALGFYSYVVNYNTSTMIAPSLAGYDVWTPTSITLNNIGADVPNQNFAGTINTYTISGTVTDGISPLPGVTLTFSHDSGSTLTDASGNYSYLVIYNTSTTITPSLAGYDVWTPTSITLNNIVADVPNQNFAGTINTYTISGTVTDGTDPLAGVTLTFSHDSGTTTTDASGNYSYIVNYNTTCTMTPSHPGYHGWTPSSITLNNIITDVPNQNFAGTINTYTISGTVTDGTDPLAGVTLTFSHDSGTTTTDASGNYSYIVDYSTSTSISPSLAGYDTWIPPLRTVSAVSSDVPGQNFIGEINTYTIETGYSGQGLINPGGDLVVEYGSDQRFDFRPDEGWFVKTLEVDGETKTPREYYNFRNVMENHTLFVTFDEDELPEITLFEATPQEGNVPLFVEFIVNGYDPDGGIISQYEWDFDGDGTIDQTSVDGEITHTFFGEGEFQVTVTIVDEEGSTDSDTLTIKVTEPATRSLYLAPAEELKDTLGLDITNWLINSTVDQAQVQLTGKNADGETTEFIDFLMNPGEKIKLDRTFFTDETTELVLLQSNRLLLVCNEIAKGEAKMAAWMPDPLASNLYIPHIAEEVNFWDTYSVISNIVKKPLDCVVADSNTSTESDYLIFHNIEDATPPDTPVNDSWGYYNYQLPGPFGAPDLVSGYELFIKENNDGAAIELVSNPSKIFYVPHIPRETELFWTGFAFLNPQEFSVNVTIEFYDINGLNCGTSLFELDALTKIKGTMETLFPDVAGVAEWAVIEADGKIVAVELYGTYEAGICGYGLPVSPEKDMILPLVKDGEDEWTGVSITNPSLQKALVSIKLYDNTGTTLKGSVIVEVDSMLKFKDTLANLFPAVVLEQTDSIRIESNVEVLAIEVTGDNSWSYLQAIGGRR